MNPQPHLINDKIVYTSEVTQEQVETLTADQILELGWAKIKEI